MEKSYLKYAKEVLQKLQFDPQLFNKEKEKMKLWLQEEDQRDLEYWAQKQWPLWKPVMVDLGQD
ncbi:hypothetical protein [Persicobacter diffluens]|uniref:Uncharacterized protein n=1 Tax=Persicobacter diffluens TaxID=981 RepID=A0AAN5AL44_9BACT|nr:hypothetical protein PEDI_30240 [Persicobacter diffluens]